MNLTSRFTEIRWIFKHSNVRDLLRFAIEMCFFFFGVVAQLGDISGGCVDEVAKSLSNLESCLSKALIFMVKRLHFLSMSVGLWELLNGTDSSHDISIVYFFYMKKRENDVEQDNMELNFYSLFLPQQRLLAMFQEEGKEKKIDTENFQISKHLHLTFRSCSNLLFRFRFFSLHTGLMHV